MIKKMVTFLIFILVTIQIYGCAGQSEYIAPLTIRNQTTQTIKVYVKGVDDQYDPILIGIVAAKKTVRFKDTHVSTMIYSARYLITAKYETEEVVFSQIYSIDELYKLHWEVTIPPN
jgi:hypothetical protein